MLFSVFSATEAQEMMKNSQYDLYYSPPKKKDLGSIERKTDSNNDSCA